MNINLPNGIDFAAAKEAAQRYSEGHPELYIRIASCFGLALTAEKRLHVFAPTDTPWWMKDEDRGYWKAGKFKRFTTKQYIADERATPNMS